MSDEITLFCWRSDSPFESIFPIKLLRSESVAVLKVEIWKTNQRSFRHVDSKDLELWKVDPPISVGDLDRKLANARSPEEVPGATELSSPLSAHFGSGGINAVRIIVNLPSMFDPVLRSIPSPPTIQVTWSPRRDTVTNLYERLKDRRLIQVQGTPGSGKTTLMDLLHAHILSHDPEAVVEVIRSWPKEPRLTYEKRMTDRIKTFPSISVGRKYLLFDNAHATYWDKELWGIFLKDTVQRRIGPRAILFCSSGYDNEQEEETNPLCLSGCSRVSLRPLCDCEYHLPISLLFTPPEFQEALQCFMGRDSVDLMLDEELRNILHDWTSGHAGAIISLLSKMSDARRKEVREGKTLNISALFEMEPKQPFENALDSLEIFGPIELDSNTGT